MPQSDVQNLEDTLINDNGTAPEAAQQGAPQTTPVQPQAGIQAPQQAGGSSALPAALLDRARGAGLKLDGIDNHERLSEYLLDQYLQTRPYADLGRQSLSQSQQAQQPAQAGKGQDQQGQVENEVEESFDLDGHFNGLWSAPQLDAASQYAIQNGIVTLGDNGLYQAAEGLESMALPLLTKLNEAHISQKQQMQKLFDGNFFTNVDNGIWPAVEYRVKKMLNERLTQQFQGYKQEQETNGFLDKFREQNKDWLYTPDGQAFTDHGQKFSTKVEELMSYGLDLNKAVEVAQGLMPKPSNGQPTNTPPVAPGTAPQATTPRDEQGRFIAGKDAPPVAPPPSKQETFLDDARRKAAGAGSQQGYSEAGGDLVTDGDPENIWSQAWNKHTGGIAVK